LNGAGTLKTPFGICYNFKFLKLAAKIILYFIYRLLKLTMQNDKFLFLDCIYTFAKKQSSMFGDMMGMMGKLKDAQKSAEETKVRMNSVMVSDDAAGGAIRITASANKEIKEIEISDALMQDKEELIDLLIVALNKTLKKAGEVQEKEMQTSMKENMPNIPGLNL